MSELEFNEIITLICKEDNRYAPNAYGFVRDALNSTVRSIKRKGTEYPHISAKELLNGIREYGLKQFGPLTKTVLNFWGVETCEDFGEIVYNLIDYKIFNRSREDRKEDFANGYDFDDAFVKPYGPGRQEKSSSCPKVPTA